MNIATKKAIQMAAFGLTLLVAYYGIAWALDKVPTDGKDTDEPAMDVRRSKDAPSLEVKNETTP